MGPATITITRFLHWHLSPMLAALGQGRWAIHAALGPSSRKSWPHQRWWGGRGIQQDPPLAHHDLCCPPQPAAGNRTCWGRPTLTHLWGLTPVMGLLGQMAVQGIEDFNTPSETSHCWTADPSLSQSQALVIVSPKEILFLYYFYSVLFLSSCPKFNKTTSESLQVLASIEEPRRTVWKKQRKTTKVMTREEFS